MISRLHTRLPSWNDMMLAIKSAHSIILYHNKTSYICCDFVLLLIHLHQNVRQILGCGMYPPRSLLVKLEIDEGVILLELDLSLSLLRQHHAHQLVFIVLGILILSQPLSLRSRHAPLTIIPVLQQFLLCSVQFCLILLVLLTC